MSVSIASRDRCVSDKSLRMLEIKRLSASPSESRSDNVFKLGTQPGRPISTSSCCGRLQKTNDAALGSSLLSCDGLGVCIQRASARSVPKLFLRHFNVGLVALNNEEYVCRKVCDPMCCVIPTLAAAREGTGFGGK